MGVGAIRAMLRAPGSSATPRPAIPHAPALEARVVSHAYRSEHGERLPALDGVSFTVRPGEFVALVGPSGCGKTTLLRAAAGLLEPERGEVRVLGAPPRRAAAEHALGLVTQEPGLLPWRTVEGNVALALELAGQSRRGRGTVGSEVRALLARVGIEHFARYYPRELSGGMRQRVALARALAHRPRLLLMDEPFGALDELSREELRGELLRLWEAERASVLFVTHAIREAVLLADRVVVLGPRPARVVAELEVTLPRPRDEALEADPAFLALVASVRESLGAAGGLAASTTSEASR